MEGGNEIDRLCYAFINERSKRALSLLHSPHPNRRIYENMSLLNERLIHIW